MLPAALWIVRVAEFVASWALFPLVVTVYSGAAVYEASFLRRSRRRIHDKVW